MALDVYFKEDVANAIRAAAKSMTPPDVIKLIESDTDRATIIELIKVYQQGYVDALRTIAETFGV